MVQTKKIYLGAGCFWCTEAVFKLFPGITKITPGYAGGHVKNPTYKQVCTGTTGHAEVAMIEYNPSEISLEKLLEIYFAMHDPTSKNRQGADVGEQYRSIILYTDESDRKEIDLYIDKIRPNFSKPILTEVKKLDEFYEAEDYHKNYYENNRFQPYCMLVISPKLSKIRKEFGIKSKD